MNEVVALVPIAGLKYYKDEQDFKRMIYEGQPLALKVAHSGVVEVWTRDSRTHKLLEQVASYATGKFKQKKANFIDLIAEKYPYILYEFLSDKEAVEEIAEDDGKIANDFRLIAIDYHGQNIGIMIAAEQANELLKGSLTAGSGLGGSYLINSLGSTTWSTTTVEGISTTTNTTKPKEERKENKKMNLNFNDLGLRFGKATSNFKLSINGIAVQGQNKDYFVWDAKNSTLINVSNMVFDFDALYFMPTKEVKVGDTILHAGTAVSITEVKEGKVTGVRYSDQTEVTIAAMKNIFGFNFYTKVVNLFGDGFLSGITGSTSGEFNPMMLMLLSQGGSNFGDMGQMILMSQLGGSLFK